MSTMPAKPSDEIAAIASQIGDQKKSNLDSFDPKSGEGFSEKLVDAIEMIGEETAAGMAPSAPPSEISPGMRYLHCSRTIHQLVTDRNRAVGIYMGVASLLLTASSFIYQARPLGLQIIPIETIQRWSLPIAFGTLTVLAFFVAILMIRTRVGLIYEVAKMNALLGLPIGRVSRIQPLSIAFILQAIISLAGGSCGAAFSLYMMVLADPNWPLVGVWAILIGLLITVGLLLLYTLTVSYTTSDKRLQSLK